MTNISHVKPTTGKGEKIGCVRPCLTTVLSFGKGELPISASTMNLMMFVSPYVDLDGRIVLEMDEIRQRLFVQHKTFYHALHQALEHRLLYKRDGFYYSNFHIHTTGDSGKAEYLKLLKVYTSQRFSTIHSTRSGYSIISFRSPLLVNGNAFVLRTSTKIN